MHQPEFYIQGLSFTFRSNFQPPSRKIRWLTYFRCLTNGFCPNVYGPKLPMQRVAQLVGHCYKEEWHRYGQILPLPGPMASLRIAHRFALMI